MKLDRDERTVRAFRQVAAAVADVVERTGATIEVCPECKCRRAGTRTRTLVMHGVERGRLCGPCDVNLPR